MKEEINTEASQEEVVDTVVEENAEVLEEEVQEKTVEEQLLDAHNEIADLKERMLRIAAESDNFKKRMERDHTATLKYAGEKIFKQLLPVIDNLERAVSQGIVDTVSAEKNLESLKEGVELTLKSLLSTLEKFEVKPFDSVGKEFDPKCQEALTMDPNSDLPPNHVTTEFEKGYYYKDRLLRAAKVVVSPK